MKRHLLTLLILIAAIASYLVGFESSAFVFIVLGGALELWFWIRALGHRDKTNSVGQRT